MSGAANTGDFGRSIETDTCTVVRVRAGVVPLQVARQHTMISERPKDFTTMGTGHGTPLGIYSENNACGRGFFKARMWNMLMLNL